MPEEKPTIHTLQGDLAAAVNSEDYGKNIIKIVTDPQKNTFYQPEIKKSVNFSFSNQKIISIAIIIMIVIVILGFLIFYFLQKPAKTTGSDYLAENNNQVATNTPQLIFKN